MTPLPAMLNVAGRRCVIVGGGSVAQRRAGSMLQAGAQVVIVAPSVEFDLSALTAHAPSGASVRVDARPYQRGDLDGAFLVIIATDDARVNEQVAADARQAGALVNRADDPAAGDVVIPAHAHHGPVTLAVYTDGISPAAAAVIRRQLSAALDPDWPRLLEIVAPYRTRIQQAIADATRRQRCLTALTDDLAMRMLQTEGDQALRAHCERLTAGDLQ